MTKLPDSDRCGWCRRPIDQKPGSGRPRRFCCRSHRQRAYEARRTADRLDVPDGQVIVSEDELQKVHDRLYRLEAAIEDVDGGLEGTPGVAAYRAAFEHLYEAAHDLVGVVIEPVRH